MTIGDRLIKALGQDRPQLERSISTSEKRLQEHQVRITRLRLMADLKTRQKEAQQ